jgi:hypothetical protein
VFGKCECAFRKEERKDRDSVKEIFTNIDVRSLYVCLALVCYKSVMVRPM